MNRFLKSAILTIAVTATTLSVLPAAQAGEGWRRHGSENNWRRHNNGGDGWRRHHSSNGDLVAAGVLGLAVGAIAAGVATASEPDYYEPVPVYRDPRPRPRPQRYYVTEPEVVYADRYSSVEPWTAEWYDYCDSRYRSFNARTGTYTGYDGAQHFCVAN